MGMVLHEMSEEQLKEMGEAGRSRVKAEFSERKMAERLGEVIEEMVNAPRQAALSLQDLLLGLGVVGMLLIVGFAVIHRVLYQIQSFR